MGTAQTDCQLSVHINIITVQGKCVYSHAGFNLCETTVESHLFIIGAVSSENNKIANWNC